MRPAPVVRRGVPDDHLDMSFIDKSPGAFIAAVTAVLYTTIVIESWMLTTGSLVVMGLFMALIIVLAGALCAYIMNLMGSEEYSTGEEPVAVALAAAPAPAPVPVALPAVPAAGTHALAS